MPNNDLEALVAAANADLTDPHRNMVMRPRGDQTPRFELYHAGTSMCSQKCRVVLHEKGIPYTSHEMVILSGKGIFTEEFSAAENYRPSYVRLRMAGGADLGVDYAVEHTGVSSVETEGFDPCVVPLLVDHEKGKIIVDSLRIIEHIDAEVPDPIQLIPTDPQARAAVMHQVEIVDQTPHPGILYGFHPEDDRRPDFIVGVMGEVHDNKCKALQMFIDEQSDNATLVEAYTSKIAKELAGKALAFDPERQRGVRQRFQDIINALDAQLGAHANPWICGEDFTMADAVWGISLFRIQWLGLSVLWDGLPRVKEYTALVYSRPSVLEDVIRWPNPMPPSPYTAELEGKEAA